jgi:arylsulfatase A-like enzyme
MPEQAVRGGARPNVVVFFTDQQRWDTTGLAGNPLELTPNFDRMARAGTYLPYFFTCQPVCAPARACLQTGQYATTTGVFRNGIGLRPDAVTLAHCFRQAGYRTAYIGKWHLARSHDSPAVPPDERGGYEYWLAANTLELVSEPYRTVVYDGDGREVFLPGYRVDALTDAAIRFIHEHTVQRPEQPFFLFLSHLEPHQQNHLDDYPPPDGYRERYTGRWIPPDLAALGGSAHQHLGGYYGMVRRLDEALGRLLDALKSLGLDRRTIVVFTSDHGCHFKTRNAEYKRSGHESSIRVPCALTGPGFVGGGQVPELVSLVDLPPTLLEAAGLPVPPGMQGRSFLRLLRGDRQGWPEEVFVQISEAQVGRAVRTRRWKYGVHAPDRHGGRDPGADRYVEEYLYDLEADPYELTNLIGLESHRTVAAVLRERLRRRMVEAGEAAPVIEEAPPRRSGQRRVREDEAWA